MFRRISTLIAALWMIGMAAPAAAQQPDETILPTPSADGLFKEGPTVEPFRSFPDLSASLGWGLALASSLWGGSPLLFVPHVGVTARWAETFREESQDGVGAYPPGAFPGFAPAKLHVGFVVQVGEAMVAWRTIIDALEPTPVVEHEVSYQRAF